MSNQQKKLEALIEAFSGERVRWIIGRRRDILESGEVDEERLNATIRSIIKDEMERSLIMLELKRGEPLTIREISERTGLPERNVINHLIALKWRRSVAVVGERGDEYLFAAVEE